MNHLFSALFLFIFFIPRLVFSGTDDSAVSFIHPFIQPMPDPIYGEENAPKNIYYKFVQNHPSDAFLYALFQSEDYYPFAFDDDWDQRIMVQGLFIVPLHSIDAIFLIWPLDGGPVFQWSVVHHSFHPYWFCYTDSPSLFVPKYVPLNPNYERFHYTNLNRLYYFLERQFEFEYRLVDRYQMLKILDNILTNNESVFIDDFSRFAPRFIRNKN